jgi:hypothetical protein
MRTSALPTSRSRAAAIPDDRNATHPVIGTEDRRRSSSYGKPLVSVGAGRRVARRQRTRQVGERSNRKSTRPRDAQLPGQFAPSPVAISTTRCAASRVSSSVVSVLLLVHSTSAAPAARRARVAGGAEEPLLAHRVRSSKDRRRGSYAASRRRRTRAQSRRLSLRLRERLSSPARTPRCRRSSVPGGSLRPARTSAPA